MGEHVLEYDENIVPQETGYNCGPASAQVALSCRGIYEDESVLANECGTHTGGTDYVGLIENCLDPRLPDANYTSHDAPSDPPQQHQKDAFWDALRRSIDNGYAVVMNWVAPASNRPIGIKGSSTPGYGNYTTFHYVTAAGYDDEYPGGAVWVADSGFWPYGYWITFDQCCSLIPPKAFCYANLPHLNSEEPTVSDTDRFNYEQLCGPIDPATGYGTGWPQLGQNADGTNKYAVDALAEILSAVSAETQTQSTEPAHHAAAPDYEGLTLDQLAGPVTGDGERHGWPQLGNRSFTDALAEVNRLLGDDDSPPFARPEK
jgi:hypothetical protein